MVSSGTPLAKLLVKKKLKLYLLQKNLEYILGPIHFRKLQSLLIKIKECNLIVVLCVHLTKVCELKLEDIPLT
jgi:hypothetical protein